MDKKKLALTMAVATTLTVSSVSSSLPSVVYAQENENKIENEGNVVENGSKEATLPEETLPEEESFSEEDNLPVQEKDKANETNPQMKVVEDESITQGDSIIGPPDGSVDPNDFDLSKWDYDICEEGHMHLLNPRVNFDELDIEDTIVIPGIYYKYDGTTSYEVHLGSDGKSFTLYDDDHTFDKELKIQIGTPEHKVIADNIAWATFQLSGNLTLDVSNVDTSNITDMFSMFTSCRIFDKITGLEQWDTSNVTNMGNMFKGNETVTSSVLEKFKDWDVSKVTYMAYMFENCENLESVDVLKNWKPSALTNTGHMFSGCEKLESANLTNWDISSLETIEKMFYRCSNLKSANLHNWGSNQLSSTAFMFKDCSKLETVDLTNLDTSNITDMSSMFENCSSLTSVDTLTEWKTNSVTSMKNMFKDCSQLESIDFEKWNVSNVEDMSSMFENCSSLTSVDTLTEWNPSSATNMGNMFMRCEQLESINFEKWNVSNVEDMSGMFAGCSGLESIRSLSNWNVSNVQNMMGMFALCQNLNEIDSIRNWNTSSARSMATMFEGCKNLESVSAIQQWDLENVEDMSFMFLFCQNLTEFELGKNQKLENVQRLEYMFAGCSNLEIVDLSGWTPQSKQVILEGMIEYCPKISSIDLSSLDNSIELNAKYFADTKNRRELLDSFIEEAKEYGADFEIAETEGNPLLVLINNDSFKDKYNATTPESGYENFGREKYVFNVTYNGNGRTLTNGKETADDVVTATDFVYSTKEDVTNDFVKQINDKGNALVQNVYVDWYLDKECTKPVSEFDFTDIKHKDITLYAKYSVQVDYEFISPYDDMELPQDVLKQLPRNSVVEVGSTVKPITSKFEKVQDGNGYWEFDKWDKEEIKNIQENQTLKGTWVYKESGLVMNTAPIINVGNKTLTVGDKFNALEGVTAMDKEEGELTDKIEVLKNTVDTNKGGVYEVTYKVTDSKGASAAKTIYVTVNPKMEALNEVPTISASDKTLTVGDKFNALEGVTATDKEDGGLTDKIEVLKNTVDTNKVGVYEVTYKVTDSKGATVTKTITVTVKEKNVVTPITPEKPNDTVKPDNTTKPNKTDTPQTGDMTNLGVFATMLTATLAILAVMLGKRYKINKK